MHEKSPAEAGLKASDHEPVGVMHLQLIERGVRHVVEGGGRWAVMLGRLLRMLGREELIHMIERGLRSSWLGMLSGTLACSLACWALGGVSGRAMIKFSCWTKKPHQYARIRCDNQR